MLVDTPGIFTPRRRLDRAMVKAAWEGAGDADVIALVVDARRGLKEDVVALLEALAGRPEPKFLVLNKVDITAKIRLLSQAAEANALAAFDETFMIAAETGDGVADLKGALAARMPAGPWHYPEDQLSDISQRMLAAEITREQLYLQLHEELPYSAIVETEKWEERRDKSIGIYQAITVERDSQKAIVLGKGGARIRELGQAARVQLTSILGRTVHLFLHVKVNPDWSDDKSVYRDIGLDWSE